LADVGSDPTADDATVQRAGLAGAELRRRFPLPDHLIRATALGNALRAMEDMAGREYGLDAVVAWPRLYPLLGVQMKTVVDDRRDGLDLAVRLAVTGVVTAVLSLILLWRAGPWRALALVPLTLAIVAYRGAVLSAIAYGEAVRASIDIHRFGIFEALHLPQPANPEEERRTNRRICDLWRQGLPMTLPYASPPAGAKVGGGS
jgi:hypothetical protein